MSTRYRTWLRIEHVLEIVRRQRAHVTALGEGAAWEAVADHAAELEREARILALESGCVAHLTLTGRA